MRKRSIAILAVVAFAAVMAVLGPGARDTALACAFDPRTPEAYEADQGRTRYNAAIEAASVNRLFPSDPFFALPVVERGLRTSRVDGSPFIPATLLKAIAWVESTMTMASRSVQFDSIGPAQVSFDCGHGIMQVTSGMTTGLASDNSATPRQASIATHFAYNVARGAQILAEKWNGAPEQRPIVGTDTGGDPALVENWYYATWAYNGFTGPGASISNHPLDPAFAGPRPAYNCDGTQARNRYPYQELVWGCMAHPDTRNGQLLWQPLPATLPNLTDPRVFSAMSVANWTFPYAAMDIPTPQPAHVALVPTVTTGAAAALLGAPQLQVSTQRVQVNVNNPAGAKATVTIRNGGTGVLTWLATTSDRFLVLSPPAGAAAGSDMKCISPGCPDGQLVITVNPTLLPTARASGVIHLTSPNAGGQTVDITVNVTAEFSIGAPGTSRAR